MLSGMQCHLDSSVLRVRKIGMVVGECISQHMDTPTARLSFQVTPTSTHMHLSSEMVTDWEIS